MLGKEDIDFICDSLMQFSHEIAARIIFDIVEEIPDTATTVFPYVTNEITRRDQLYSIKLAAAYAELSLASYKVNIVH